MSRLCNLLKPNLSVKGMTKLDKSKFDKTITVPCINVMNCRLADILPCLKKYMLKVPKLKPIQAVGDKTLIMLNPEIVSSWNDIQDTDKKHLQGFSIADKNLILEDQKFNYDNYGADDILKAILPTEEEGLSSFTKVGHIIHLNLREHLLPYKNIIAQVLYDKTPHCETVVNKVNIIDNTYRNFKMEVLHGKHNLITKVKENGCQFEFDFGTVYWNSRLSTEHERIVKSIHENDVLFDIFAGVGPFSVPAAKKKCIVYANDLNPESYRWLKHNQKLNKVDETYLHMLNKDGKDFILEDVKHNLLKYVNKNNIHIVMNLPALAVEFLKYFIGLFKDNEIAKIENPPIVYVYCFAKGEDYNKITENLISSNMKRDMSDKIDMFKVRTVSSFKEMMRVTFKLTDDILIAKSICKRQNEDCNDIAAKRRLYVYL